MISNEIVVAVSPWMLTITGDTGSEVTLFKNQTKPRQMKITKMLLPMMFAIAISPKPIEGERIQFTQFHGRNMRPLCGAHLNQPLTNPNGNHSHAIFIHFSCYLSSKSYMANTEKTVSERGLMAAHFLSPLDPPLTQTDSLECLENNLPFLATITDATVSGTLLPMAKTVYPITVSGTPSV